MAAAAAALLSASASVLVFPAPFDKQQSQPLRLVNLSAAQAVAFKVRTNARDRFAVRPNSGLLPPSGSVDLTIILHGSAEHDATINAMREKSQQKDRFLVIGVPCDPSKVSGADSLAQIIAAESSPSKLKLKVRYTFDNAKPVAADATASLPSAAPAVPPSPVTSLASPAPSPAPRVAEASSIRPATATARNASPARAKSAAAAAAAAAAAPAVAVQAARPPPLTVSQLQSQVLRAKAGQELLAEASQAAASKQTNQDKYLSSFARDAAALAAEGSMSNQERFMALFEERRKLQTKLDDLALKYREVVQERDKLSGIVRESKHRQSLSQPQRADANSMSVLVILLVAILAYVVGRWRS